MNKDLSIIVKLIFLVVLNASVGNCLLNLGLEQSNCSSNLSVIPDFNRERV